MKKLIYILITFCICFICFFMFPIADYFYTDARMNVGLIGGGAASTTTTTAACATLKDSEETNYLSTNIGHSAMYTASSFTAGSSYTLCALAVNLWATSAAASDITNVTAYIYSNNATPDPDVPNAVMTDGTSSNTILYTDIDAYTAYNAAGWHTFTFPDGVDLVSGTVYWVVLKTDANDANQTEYVKWPLHNSEAAYDSVVSTGGVTWFLDQDQYQGLFRTYATE